VELFQHGRLLFFFKLLLLSEPIDKQVDETWVCLVTAILSCLFVTPGIEVIGNRLGFRPLFVIRRDTPVPIFMLYCVCEYEGNTLCAESVNDLFHAGTVKAVIAVVVGNRFFNSVLAIHVGTKRSSVFVQLIVTFGKAR